MSKLFYGSFVVSFVIGKHESSSLALVVLMDIHVHFRINLSFFSQDTRRNFDGNYIDFCHTIWGVMYCNNVKSFDSMNMGHL